MTKDCDRPPRDGKKWEDVSIWALKLLAANDECTSRMRKIRGE